MRINEFGNQVAEHVKKYLGKNVEVRLESIAKNNGYEELGLMIREENKNVSPVIYLNEYYLKYADDPEGSQRTAKEILRIYNSSKEVPFSEELEDLGDWKYVKDRLRAKLLNRNMNQQLRDSVPCREYLDLIIAPYICLRKDMDGYFVMVTKDIAKFWDVDHETILETAIHNSITQKPFLSSLESIIMAMGAMENLLGEADEECLMDKESGMYVLTNQAKVYGSIHMLNDNLLERPGSYLGKDLYILPCSVHELILLFADKKDIKPDDLTEMVREVNKTQLRMDEVLSDHAYYWNQEERRLEAA